MSDALPTLDEAFAAVPPSASAADRLKAALEWLSTQPVAGVADEGRDETWQLTAENHWEHLDPQEDLAVAPELDWPDAIKALALEACNETWGKYLEDGQFYVLVWPPRPHLWSAGDWFYPDMEACDEHSDEGPDEGCERCRATAAKPVIEELAEWEWTIQVQTWTHHQRPDGMRVPVQVWDDDVDEDRWTLGYTTMHPQHVTYGSPVRGL